MASTQLYSLLALFPIGDLCDALSLHPHHQDFQCLARTSATTRQCARRLSLMSRIEAITILAALAEPSTSPDATRLALNSLARLVLCSSHSRRNTSFMTRLWVLSLRRFHAARHASQPAVTASTTLPPPITPRLDADCTICLDALSTCQPVVWCGDSCGYCFHQSCWQTWCRVSLPRRA
jgi:hypothetical protein